MRTAEENMLILWKEFCSIVVQAKPDSVIFLDRLSGVTSKRLEACEKRLIKQKPEGGKFLCGDTAVKDGILAAKALMKREMNVKFVCGFFQCNLNGISNNYHMLVLIFDGNYICL